MTQEHEITISRSQAQSLALLVVSSILADDSIGWNMDDSESWGDLSYLTRVVAHRLEGITLYSSTKSNWMLQPTIEKPVEAVLELLD